MAPAQPNEAEMLRVVATLRRRLDREQKARRQAEEIAESATREQYLADQALRKTNEELEQKVQEREALLREVHHRVKNNLQLFSSLLGLQARKVGDRRLTEALEATRQRVRSIALIHERLYLSSDLARVSFVEYARRLATSIFQVTGASHAAVALDLAIEDVALPVDRAIPCGLIMNELITNSLMHAFPNGRVGRVRVALERTAGGGLALEVSDDGVGLPAHVDVKNSESLGLLLVSTLAAQLDAVVDVRRDRGTTFRLAFAGAP